MGLFTRRASDDEGDKGTAQQAVTSVGFETVIGASSVIEGTLRSKGNLRLNGTFSGTLEIEGNVLVGEGAVIQADVEARNISIAGEVQGNVKGNKVQILRTGRIIGDITAASLTTEEGAFIDGKVTMQPAPEVTLPEPAEKPAAATPPQPKQAIQIAVENDDDEPTKETDE